MTIEKDARQMNSAGYNRYSGITLHLVTLKPRRGRLPFIPAIYPLVGLICQMAATTFSMQSTEGRTT